MCGVSVHINFAKTVCDEFRATSWLNGATGVGYVTLGPVELALMDPGVADSIAAEFAAIARQMREHAAGRAKAPGGEFEGDAE